MTTIVIIKYLRRFKYPVPLIFLMLFESCEHTAIILLNEFVVVLRQSHRLKFLNL
jgi:hypothetical protein